LRVGPPNVEATVTREPFVIGESVQLSAV